MVQLWQKTDPEQNAVDLVLLQSTESRTFKWTTSVSLAARQHVNYMLVKPCHRWQNGKA